MAFDMQMSKVPLRYFWKNAGGYYPPLPVYGGGGRFAVEGRTSPFLISFVGEAISLPFVVLHSICAYQKRIENAKVLYPFSVCVHILISSRHSLEQFFIPTLSDRCGENRGLR